MVKHDQRRLYYRLSRSSRLRMPFGVRSAGFYQIRPQMVIDRSKVKNFTQIYWGYRGEVLFEKDKKWVTMPSQGLFVYPSGSVHHIRSGDKGSEYYWLTLDGVGADDIIKWFGFLTCPQMRVGPAPRNLWEQLIRAVQDGDLEGEREAAVLAYRILLVASQTASFQPLSVEREAWLVKLQKRLRAEIANARFAIEDWAEEERVHRSQLAREFRRFLGLSPKQYLKALRIQKAQELLRSTNYSVAQIADLSGFEDAHYFSRLFHQNTGLTPLEFRRASNGEGKGVAELKKL